MRGEVIFISHNEASCHCFFACVGVVSASESRGEKVESIVTLPLWPSIPLPSSHCAPICSKHRGHKHLPDLGSELQARVKGNHARRAVTTQADTKQAGGRRDRICKRTETGLR